MRTLIIGAGALGGLVAARLRGAGTEVWLATRDRDSAARLMATGLHATGVGGDVTTDAAPITPADDYIAHHETFDLIVLATKAHDAIEAAPRIVDLLAPGGALLPIQNGGVSQMLAERLGTGRVLGGLSNLGATMITPGHYEQRNAGHLLIGELTGGGSDRAEHIRQWLNRGIEVKVTANIRGAIWSKLLLNCAVTTIGAVAGQTMREYIASPDGRTLFDQTYDEALSVALAGGTAPERMLVDPIPPDRRRRRSPDEHRPTRDAWLGEILDGYGDLKPSMLQDFERGRTTEIDFINGYVVRLGRELGIPTPANAAIVDIVHAITQGARAPDPANLRCALDACRGPAVRATDVAPAE